jgi:hypothetical protein
MYITYLLIVLPAYSLLPAFHYLLLDSRPYAPGKSLASVVQHRSCENVGLIIEQMIVGQIQM